MRYLSAVALLVCSAVLGFTQDERNAIVCDSTPASVVGHEADVIVRKLVLRGEWGSNEVMVYLPGKDVAKSAVLFSHSAIHADSGESADLRLFALKLARAGAAVVVLQRTLIWPPADRSINRAGAPVICAQRWLVDHVKVAKNGEPETDESGGIVRYVYAYIGPRLCEPIAVADCRYTMPAQWDCVSRKRQCPATLWVPAGETEGGDSTLGMLSGKALESVHWLERRLRLAPTATTVSSTPRPGS